MNRQPRALVYAAGLACALAVTACTAAGGPGQPASAAATVAGWPVIGVGSFNFPESVTLAYLYADALAGRATRCGCCAAWVRGSWSTRR